MTHDDGTKTEVRRFTLTNSAGMSVGLSQFGATLLEVNVPDRDGQMANVNVCFDNLDRYVAGHPYFGASVGRYANRIENATFQIDGQTYELSKNHGDHILHGGAKNFAFQVWDATTRQDDDSASVEFRLTSPDGENGFPGTVTATAVYTLGQSGDLTIEFTGTTDKATHLSLTNHSYFNLGGVGTGKVLDHIATIPAAEMLAVDDDLIPHGGMTPVESTPFDFRSPTEIGSRIDQLPETGGYDHCYVVPGTAGQLRHAAKVVDPDSGRTMTVETTLPGMQFYTANHLSGDASSAGLSPHDAFCVECQMFPNSPNVPSFPSTLINPGQTFTAKTIHRFGIEQ